jgi:hypothetical protein
MSTSVIVALITGAFSVLVVLIQMSRRENRADHGQVAEALKQVSNEVQTVGKKVDRHINWHAEGNTHGRTIRPDKE